MKFVCKQSNSKNILNIHSVTRTALLIGLGLVTYTALATEIEGSRNLFIASAVENAADDTVKLPVFRGVSQGQTVWYVVLDASTNSSAIKYGVNRANKLINTKNTTAVQKVRVVNGVIDFPATINFNADNLENSVVAGPTGFPPEAVHPGAMGFPGYSPLIQLPDGTILNAPQLANDSGQADKVVTLDTVAGNVVFKETRGFANGREVRYISTDASDFAAAALEDVTFAPQLNSAPNFGDDSTKSARASLAAFTNGQIGVGNPERQGLNSAILDGLSPLNILRWTPNQGRYSPLWDVHLTTWSDAAIARGENLQQRDFGRIQGLSDANLVTSFGGGKFGPAGFVVNCPVISEIN